MSNANCSKRERSWQEALSDLITDPKELLSILELDSHLLGACLEAAKQFPLRVTRGFVSRMEKGNPNDPLLKQVLPLDKEMQIVHGFMNDPLQEANTTIPGLLHKYHGRVLVTLTSTCAIHCRYCFRRHFPYADNRPGKAGLMKIFDYIAQNDSISEVILSGGDPLAVNDHLLNHFSAGLDKIAHVKRLRIHTRLPVVLPERITPQLIDWINQLSQDSVMVIHANHPQEINFEVQEALRCLRQTNMILLNQSVLLKGINDNAAILIELSEKLFQSCVLPYYLHVLDPVQGAAHFDTERSTALSLHQEMTKKLPGYLVPKLVQELPGELSKTLVLPK